MKDTCDLKTLYNLNKLVTFVNHLNNQNLCNKSYTSTTIYSTINKRNIVRDLKASTIF